MAQPIKQPINQQTDGERIIEMGIMGGMSMREIAEELEAEPEDIHAAMRQTLRDWQYRVPL